MSNHKAPFISQGLDRQQLTNKEVINAMERVPRHRFVPAQVASHAYEDRALSIGSGQTISQPFIVALMTQEAKVSKGSKVLEIGTGSGYQAAVLSELGADVFTIEIIPELSEKAQLALDGTGYKNVNFLVGDGSQGWQEHAPYDAILVTAAAPYPPPELLRQLANRGRMVVPIEQENGDGETLLVIERNGADFSTKNLGPVKFVPLLGNTRLEAPAADTLKWMNEPSESKKRPMFSPLRK